VAVTVKPYYNYKKEVYNSFSSSILSLLRRVNSLKDILSKQANITDFEFIISHGGDTLDNVDIYYLGRYSLGRIFFTTFGFPMFFVAPEYARVEGYGGGVVLEKSEATTLNRAGLALLKASENSTTPPINGVANVNAFNITLTYTNEQGTSVNSILWTDKG